MHLSPTSKLGYLSFNENIITMTMAMDYFYFHASKHLHIHIYMLQTMEIRKSQEVIYFNIII